MKGLGVRGRFNRGFPAPHAYLPTYLPTYLPIYLRTCPPTYLPSYLLGVRGKGKTRFPRPPPPPTPLLSHTHTHLLSLSLVCYGLGYTEVSPHPARPRGSVPPVLAVEPARSRVQGSGARPTRPCRRICHVSPSVSPRRTRNYVEIFLSQKVFIKLLCKIHSHRKLSTYPLYK